MPSTTRRAFLGAAATGLTGLAGCDSLGENDPTVELTLHVDRLDRPLAATLLWTPPERAADHPVQRTRRRAVAAAVDGERVSTYGYGVVPDGEYVEHDGRYYLLHDVITGSERIERSVLRLSWVGRVDSEETPEGTPREALPEYDQNAVMPAFFAARAEEHGGGAPWDFIEQGGFVYRHLDEVESELAPDPEHEYVAVHGTVLKVTVAQETLVEPEHTGFATEVADSAAAFDDVADAATVERRLAPDDLGPDVRDLFERVRGLERYSETMPLSDTFESLVETLRMRDALDCTPENCRPRMYETEYLAYDGEYYDCALYTNVTE
ncbi:hypothetical protein [Haloarcula pellucida]|uniref:Uncharacterized protein n=1 Tax=Haloarcula pellucida TaxID=1427151 RepID=A0A830GQ20_9EURY|nr:hypothetical protein [Halomicroarcula pellucida]MBX0350342.1 hypothetical protein [Halomicroarcula pellucida]GGO01604.1 hypothetical protein GCM10009030_35450 [Halomicroarcula pellucida]